MYAEVEGNKEELITIWDQLANVEQALGDVDVDEDTITGESDEMIYYKQSKSSG